ncbi:hypothetical protein LCGC14_2858040, partial [marine sediment metagenome]
DRICPHLSGQMQLRWHNKPARLSLRYRQKRHQSLLKCGETQIRTSSLESIDIDGDLVLKHDSPTSPLDDLYRKELRQTLKKAIANLPPKSRQAVELVYIHHLKPAQAAAHSGRDIVAFYNSLQYGLTKIKAELQDPQEKF